MVGSGVMVCWLVACAGAGGQVSENDQQALDAAQKQRHELLAKLQAESTQADGCRVSDGDCLLTVSEKREQLFEPSPKCDGQSDVFERETCQADLLAKQGDVKAVTEFFQYENWCLTRVVECADQVVAKQSQAEHAAMLEARRQALASAGNAERLTLDTAYARERAAYLRATVPENRDGVCLDLPDVKSCRERAQAAEQKLEAELAKDDASYDEKLAAELFQSEIQTEAECFEAEYACLNEVVRNYGANRESRHHLKRNLELLEKMQALASKLPQAASQECLAAGEAEYGSRVEKTYANYAKKPNTLFRVLLHQAFVKLHKVQLECLKQHSG